MKQVPTQVWQHMSHLPKPARTHFECRKMIFWLYVMVDISL